MYSAYKFRLYPTGEQKVSLAKSFGCVRWYWNYSLNLCQETYKSTGKGLSRGAIQGLLPSLKKEYQWLSDAYSQCLQVVALNLSTAFKNFFDKRAGLPSFKSKHGRQSISYPQHVKLEGDRIKLPGKVGTVFCKPDREIVGTIKTVTISLYPDGRYFASILVDDGKEAPTPNPDGKAIGIDLGLTHFCITSDGSKFDNPHHTQKHARNLKKKQQSLARKKKGSNSRLKAKKLVARVHSKIRRVREDFLHKLSRKIVTENQVIALENLAVKNMVKNHNLAKAISDCGWSMFCTMLKYKAEKEGKVYLEVDRFFASSKTCNVCLNKVGSLRSKGVLEVPSRTYSLPLDVRFWDCDRCGTKQIDRDVNAAKNIRDEALRILSLGTSDTANGGNVSQRSEGCLPVTGRQPSPGKTSVLLDAIPDEIGNSHLAQAGGE